MINFNNYFFWILISLTNICFADDNFFNDILLIVNYNHPHYNSIGLLKKCYGKYFSKIIFYGPKIDKDVIYCDHYKGWYCYKTLADAMKKYPNYDGYLYIHDDCIINPETFISFDKYKIWLMNPWAGYDLKKGLNAMLFKNWIWSRPNKMYSKITFNCLNDWEWWKHDCGFKAINKTYNSLPSKYLNILKTNWQDGGILIGYSDIAYIPKRLKDDFISLSQIFEKNKVFLEIAVPTICSSIEFFYNWQILSGIEFGTKELYSPYLNFLHPIKLSSIENQNFMLKIFNIINK